MNRPRIRDINETEHERYVRRWSDPVAREKIKARNKAAKYMDRYGITIDEANRIKANGCEVCGTTRVKLCLDHCHRTGMIRGCLCSNCNTSLGKLNDDYDLILRLAGYLRKHQRAHAASLLSGDGATESP